MSGFPVISNFEVEEKDEGTLHDPYLYKHAWAWAFLDIGCQNNFDIQFEGANNKLTFKGQ